MDRQPIGAINTRPDSPSVGVTDFQYVVMPGHPALTISVDLPLGAELLATNMEGTYTSYAVLIVDENGDEVVQKVCLPRFK